MDSKSMRLYAALQEGDVLIVAATQQDRQDLLAGLLEQIRREKGKSAARSKDGVRITIEGSSGTIRIMTSEALRRGWADGMRPKTVAYYDAMAEMMAEQSGAKLRTFRQLLEG